LTLVPPSSAFIDTLRFGSYLVEAQVTIYQAGIPTQYLVPVSDAQITIDRNSAQRRSGQITFELVPSVPPPPLVPTNPNSLLTPFGNELSIGYAVYTPGQTPEFAPLGLYTMTTVTVDDSTVDLVVTADISDRSFVISQRAFLQPYNFPATELGLFTDEIEALLTLVWGYNQVTLQPIPNTPPLVFNIEPTDATVPQATYDQGSDPWQAALDMANAIGYELYFGMGGQVVAHPIPNPLQLPIAWYFTDDVTAVQFSPAFSDGGSPYTTPIEVQSIFTRDGIYNDIFITGTGTSNAPDSNTGNYEPVIARAPDLNATSSTFIYGPVGDVPEFVTSNLSVSTAQAQATANNDLVNSASAAWQIKITAAPNPLFDVDQVVSVSRPRIGLNALMVLDTIEHVISYADTLVLTGRVVQNFGVT